MKTLITKLLGISSAVWAFYAPLLGSMIVSSASALLPIALEIVRSLAQTEKSGAQKRDDALSALKAAAIRQGIDASESLLRFTVESAVQRIKVS
jgi:hypothetical protein